MLGPPPLDSLKCGKRSKEFFDDEGMLRDVGVLPPSCRVLLECHHEADVLCVGNWIADLSIPEGLMLKLWRGILLEKSKRYY
jgi:hypothetical protein